jgi:3-oxoacyl-[acyl-carrier-protein] synthase-3
MSSLRRVGISGVGRYVPERRLTNAELERMVDTSDEWITQRSGIRERRIAGPDEAASDMATRAAEVAIQDAGVDPADIDIVMCCTVSGDQPFPATACSVAERIGAHRAGAWDLAAACSGWVIGAQTAAQFVATGASRHVLVVGVEKLSAIVDYTDRGTCVLFGDGAGATLFSPLEEAGRGEFLSGSVGNKGCSEHLLSVPAGGSRKPASHDTIERREHFMRMEGRQIYRFAVKTFAETVAKALAPYDREELGILVPHQVNQRIIESAAEQVGIPMEKIVVNIDRYGNTSAASVPIALSEALESERFEKGKLVCTVAFGAGLSWGHALFRW